MTIGIASWGGLGVSFTDGMCRGCAIRFRRQWNLPEMSGESPARAPTLLRGVVTLGVVTILILAVGSSDNGRTPATMTPPPETVLVPTPAEAEPTPAAPGPPASQRSRPAASPRVSPSAVAITEPPTAPDPAFSFAEMDTEAIGVVSTAATEPDTMEPVGTSATRRRFPIPSEFAALPHAGLAQQTP